MKTAIDCTDMPMFRKHMAQIWSDEKYIQAAMMRDKGADEILRIAREHKELAEEYEQTRIF